MIPDMIDWLCGSANEDGGDGEVYSKENIQKLTEEVQRTYAGPWEEVELTGMPLGLFVTLFDDEGNVRQVYREKLATAQQEADDRVAQIAAASRVYVEELRGQIAALTAQLAERTHQNLELGSERTVIEGLG